MKRSKQEEGVAPRHGAWLVGASLALAVLAAPRSQQVRVTLTDGALVHGVLRGLVGEAREAGLELDLGEAGTRRLPLARVLAVHGAPPEPAGDVLAHLVGGDEIRGALAGGDAAGESFTLQSRSLGTVIVPVDRLQTLLFPARAAGRGPAEFALPEGSEADEALFRPTARGFDVVVGAIHRFTPSGVLFEGSVGAEPRQFPYRDLGAVALRDGLPREAAADVHLVTRSGDALRLALRGLDGGMLRGVAEAERELEVPLSEIAALTLQRADRVYLSDLEPERVEEAGHAFGDDALPLYRYAEDRAATGGFLVAGGMPFGKGLGVHSRCSLTYRVPEGCDRFLAWVAIDDAVLETPVRGSAEVRVAPAGGAVAFGPKTVRSGAAPAAVGPLAVTPGALLTLHVEFGEGWFVGDRVDWLQAVFLAAR
ncbi:MAG: NPCBM/NEW2 domain-containing protein [Planctomycetota bacterium]